jgi:hypothetical protein
MQVRSNSTSGAFMEIDTEDILLQKCRALIEENLGWGNPAAWATNDYELLSQKIQEKTGVSLSIATLKRIWGKIRYDSKPTITTLNTLAQYLGFETWRSFTQRHASLNEKSESHLGNGQLPAPAPLRKKAPRWIIGIAMITLAAGTFVVLRMERNPVTPPDPSRFKFSSKKVVDEGVPNTVIFDYDASAASPKDTIFIQQSWDKRLRAPVSFDGKQHTSIYYYPGFFEAKLVVNENVVKEHSLFIKTNGWLPCIERKPVPIYFKESEIRHDGMMTLPLSKINEANIPLQPTVPWIAFYNVRDFGSVKSDDFIFETSVRNDYREGAAVCQMTAVHVMMEGSALVVPLSIKGCVGELNFMGRDGKKSDLSAFGVDFTNWVNVKCIFNGKEAKVFINDREAFTLNTSMAAPAKVIGIGYRFQGTGSVQYAKLYNSKGQYFYDESF